MGLERNIAFVVIIRKLGKIAAAGRQVERGGRRGAVIAAALWGAVITAAAAGIQGR